MSAERNTRNPVSNPRVPTIANSDGEDQEEDFEFVPVGSWLPPPQKRMQFTGSTEHSQAVHAQVSRSPSIADQPGLIPVEEPIRFPTPSAFIGLGPKASHANNPTDGYASSGNEHWQPFRPDHAQDSGATSSQMNSEALEHQFPTYHLDRVPQRHGHTDATQQGLQPQHASSPRPHPDGQRFGPSGSHRPRDDGVSGDHSANTHTEPTTPGYSLVTVAETTWYSSSEAEHDTQRIITALASSHPDAEELIDVLSRHPHPFEIASRKLAYRRKFTTPKAKQILDAVEDAPGEFSSGFKTLLYALAGGPLELDAHFLFRAIVGAGTNEEYLQLVLLGRTNHEIKAIAAQYEVINRNRAMLAGKETETLRSALEGDVRGNLRKLYFGILLAARRWEDSRIPIPHVELQGDILDLSAALTGELDVDKVLKYFVSASYHRLASISAKWKEITGDDETLEKRIEDRFHRDLEDALLYILSSARDRATRDAMMIHETLTRSALRLAKSGRFPLRHTKQEEIALLVVKMVWQDQILEGRAKASGDGVIYNRGSYLREVDARYVGLLQSNSEPAVRGDLLRKIQAETSGDFNKLLVMLWRRREGA